MSDFTLILERAQSGDPKAGEELLPLVYGELRQLAAARMARELPGQTLQPTALVHEAWLRLAGSGGSQWNSRGHFISAAAEAMRRILIEAARRKKALRRGGGAVREELDEDRLVVERPPDEMLAVHEVLDALGREDAQAAELVKLRYFLGMSIPEVATALGIAPRSADRLWAYARCWLQSALEESPRK